MLKKVPTESIVCFLARNVKRILPFSHIDATVFSIERFYFVNRCIVLSCFARFGLICIKRCIKIEKYLHFLFEISKSSYSVLVYDSARNGTN